MSYLNTLNRAAKSPTIDFHFLITKYPSQRSKCYDFFEDKAVLGIFVKMEQLDAQNINIEKKYTNDLGKPANMRPEEEMEHKQWNKNNELWTKCHDHYYKKLKKINFTDNIEKFGTKKTSTEQRTIEQELIKEDSVDKPSENNGISFLMSIAGMFDSGDKNGSKNIKSVVSESILKKYGKK
ncbi:MAG: hypothetical protein JRJ49_08815 [Deltaproteobacteria bacterium]|nr:hypothetical protein [Deltaproteobacteria bacterium]